MKILAALFAFLFFSILPSPSSAGSDCGFLKGVETDSRIACGRLEVPEDHAKPGGRKIKIAYIVLRSVSPERRPDPVIFFSGGPGGASLGPGLIGFLKSSPIAETRDVILFDQRGIQYSSALPDIGRAVFDAMAADVDMNGERRLIAEALKEYKKKAVSSGIDLGNYNSFQNARDVGVLMEKLGYPKYNLFGISYGTRLARLLSDMYPEKLNAAVLDSPNLMTDDFLIDRLKSYSSSADKVIKACASDPACREEHPRLEAEYGAVVNALKKRPLAIDMGGRTFYMNSQDAMYFLRRQLYRDDALEVFPAFVEALKTGKADVLKNAVQTELEDVNDGSFNTSMFLAVSAYESMDPANTPARIAETYSKLPHFPDQLAFFTNLYIEGMNWGGKSLPVAQRRFKDSDVPAIIFVNRYDPVTPPENGAFFRQQLGGSHLFIIDQGGHGGGDLRCKMKVMSAFMDDPKSRPDASCLKLVPDQASFTFPLDFDTVVSER